MAIRERLLGPNDPVLAGSLNNIATLLMDLRRHDEALPLLRRAATISGDGVGRAHPEHATALSNLAGALQHLRRHAEAHPHLKRALSINKGALGPAHSATEAVASRLRECEAAMKGNGNAQPPSAPAPKADGRSKRKRARKAAVIDEL